MRAVSVLLLSALLLVLSCGTASSSTLYVPDGYPTIQAAVDNATPGDTIVIRNGTYLENVVVNKSLTVVDNSGANNSTTHPVVVYMAGDANEDGRVDILDAAIVGLNWSRVASSGGV